jgi:hypothetical protein
MERIMQYKRPVRDESYYEGILSGIESALKAMTVETTGGNDSTEITTKENSDERLPRKRKAIKRNKRIKHRK